MVSYLKLILVISCMDSSLLIPYLAKDPSFSRLSSLFAHFCYTFDPFQFRMISPPDEAYDDASRSSDFNSKITSEMNYDRILMLALLTRCRIPCP